MSERKRPTIVSDIRVQNEIDYCRKKIKRYEERILELERELE